MNKNIIILSVVLFALVAALGVMLSFGNNSNFTAAPIVKNVTGQELDKNVAELNSLDTELTYSSQDSIVANELDTTLNEVGEISGSTASLSGDEENLSNLDSDLTNLSGDEKINQEIDQSLRDVSL